MNPELKFDTASSEHSIKNVRIKEDDRSKLIWDFNGTTHYIIVRNNSSPLSINIYKEIIKETFPLFKNYENDNATNRDAFVYLLSHSKFFNTEGNFYSIPEDADSYVMNSYVVFACSKEDDKFIIYLPNEEDTMKTYQIMLPNILNIKIIQEKAKKCFFRKPRATGFYSYQFDKKKIKAGSCYYEMGGFKYIVTELMVQRGFKLDCRENAFPQICSDDANLKINLIQENFE